MFILLHFGPCLSDVGNNTHIEILVFFVSYVCQIICKLFLFGVKKDKGQTEKRPIWEILILKLILKSNFCVTYLDTELTFNGKLFPLNVNSTIIYHLLRKKTMIIYSE